MKPSKPLLAAVAAAVAGVMTMPAGNAADLSGERTYMPDYCTNRDVNCVVPDGAPPPVRYGGAAATAGSATTGSTGSSTASTGTGAASAVPTVPAVPTLSGQVPTLSGQVPSLPAQVPSTTSSAGAPDIAPNPSTARELSRSGSGASGAAATGASGTSSAGGAAGGGGNASGGDAAGRR